MSFSFLFLLSPEAYLTIFNIPPFLFTCLFLFICSFSVPSAFILLSLCLLCLLSLLCFLSLYLLYSFSLYSIPYHLFISFSLLTCFFFVLFSFLSMLSFSLLSPSLFYCSFSICFFIFSPSLSLFTLPTLTLSYLLYFLLCFRFSFYHSHFYVLAFSSLFFHIHFLSLCFLSHPSHSFLSISIFSLFVSPFCNNIPFFSFLSFSQFLIFSSIISLSPSDPDPISWWSFFSLFFYCSLSSFSFHPYT